MGSPVPKDGKAVLIYTSDTPDSINVIQEKLGVELAGNLVKEAFSLVELSVGGKKFINTINL